MCVGSIVTLVEVVDEDGFRVGRLADGVSVPLTFVPDAQAGGAAEEAAVGEQQDVLAEAGALDGTGHRQHFAHARATLGPLVPDHHDVAGVQAAVLDGVHGGALAI